MRYFPDSDTALPHLVPRPHNFYDFTNADKTRRRPWTRREGWDFIGMLSELEDVPLGDGTSRDFILYTLVQ